MLADIKKYELSVMSLKARCTTGRVWPLHVKGVCLKFAIYTIITKTNYESFTSEYRTDTSPDTPHTTRHSQLDTGKVF